MVRLRVEVLLYDARGGSCRAEPIVAYPPGPILGCFLVVTAFVPAAAEGAVDVLTLNAWHGLRPSVALRLDGEPTARRDARRAIQIDALAEIAPDVVFLQELNPVAALARFYAVALGYDEVHKVDSCGIRIGRCGVPSNVRSGLAILARPALGLERLGAQRLSGSGMCSDLAGLQLSESRYALFARITLAGSRLLLVNVHLHNVPGDPIRSDPRLAELVRAGELEVEDAARVVARIERRARRQEREVEALIAAIEKRARGSDYSGIVVAGDLNAEPGSPTLEALARHGFRPALEPIPTPSYDPRVNSENATLAVPQRGPYPTFGSPALARLFADEQNRPRRIDHVLVRGDLDLRDTERALDRPRDGLFPSDHFGIRARIVVARP
jgi:endonuclease/exonuclease/phosphatase family metal-dependent hydrolase